MIKMTKDKKELFRGHGGTIGKIRNSEVILKPNLMQMSAKEIYKWQNKLDSYSFVISVKKHSIITERNRVSYYIRFSCKNIIITKKDLERLILKKRNIIAEAIVVDSVGLICDGSGDLDVEYY